MPDTPSRMPNSTLLPLLWAYGTACEPLPCTPLVHPLCIWTFNVTDPERRTALSPGRLVARSVITLEDFEL
jgi:hypothetical protein